MKRLLVGMAFAAVASAAQAQQFTPMQNDPGLLQAINEMASLFGGNCQNGSQQGCQGYSYIMSNAGAMSQASNACMQGNHQGCQYYMMYYRQMEHDYSHYQQAVASQYGGGYGGGSYGGGNPLGDTHLERMQAIQSFGAQNTQNFEARMSQMDASHSNWMQSQGYAH